MASLQLQHTKALEGSFVGGKSALMRKQEFADRDDLIEQALQRSQMNIDKYRQSQMAAKKEAEEKRLAGSSALVQNLSLFTSKVKEMGSKAYNATTVIGEIVLNTMNPQHFWNDGDPECDATYINDLINRLGKVIEFERGKGYNYVGIQNGQGQEVPMSVQLAFQISTETGEVMKHYEELLQTIAERKELCARIFCFDAEAEKLGLHFDQAAFFENVERRMNKEVVEKFFSWIQNNDIDLGGIDADHITNQIQHIAMADIKVVTKDDLTSTITFGEFHQELRKRLDMLKTDTAWLMTNLETLHNLLTANVENI